MVDDLPNLGAVTWSTPHSSTETITRKQVNSLPTSFLTLNHLSPEISQVHGGCGVNCKSPYTLTVPVKIITKVLRILIVL